MPIEESLMTGSSGGLARGATLLSIGNVASRVLGLAREMVISRIFVTAEIGAFTVASQVPTLLYDFLIGGMLSAALVPVLSDYAERGPRAFARLVSVLLTLFGLLLALLTLALYLLAPQVANLMTNFDQSQTDLAVLTVQLIRQITPAIWLFSMAGLLTAVLYALRRFTWPALATALYNLGIVLAAPLLAPRIGITSLVVGILLGAMAQFLLMGLDLRRVGLPLRPNFDWRHPALGRIIRLYLPIALGLVVALFQVGLDRNLATSTGADSVAWMRFATTLQQLPLGLISVAISLAALPQLSQYYAANNEGAYRQTLGRGLRMVFFLLLPAAVLLWILGEPIARLIFSNSSDLPEIVAALQIYLIGMLFAAIDFPLNYAFYARKNTLLPAVVGGLSVGVYVGCAFSLLAPLGYLGLVWADTAKQASHAIVMVLLLTWRVGRLGARVGQGLVQMGSAALVMAGILSLAVYLIGAAWPVQWLANGTLLVVVGGMGLVGYVVVLRIFAVQELIQIGEIVRTRIPGYLSK
ncbi:MAG: murein biosynthesis integral membrane protein MurJ [Caldilineaceae bacterium]|nr:murein biosynthesis integral membrane protein MurJ [Caldilineaceae bacterium]